ncbi:MAG TPA: histidine kinase [Cytophagaceae bacterium]|jgi:two-component system LytT family sensor kinase|nr:histidine kinase [Cytophagaceae bacterium]
MKNPFLKNAKTLRIYLLVWAIIAAAHTGILYVYEHLSFFLSLADSLTYNILYAGLALNFWYAVRYLNIEKQKPLLVLVAHIIAAKVFLVLWLLTGNYLMYLIDTGDTAYRDFTVSSFLGRSICGLLYYSIIILVYYLFIYYSSYHEKLIREANLRTLVKETELSLLRSQLNPHFIFNSLNSISSLTLSDPRKAQDMVVTLSSYLRYALEHNHNKLISFSEELENSLLYLQIEKVRFGAKLIFEKEIDVGCENTFVPNMLLQPLLENAIKHGIYESREPVLIAMKCTKENNFLRINISNNFEKGDSMKKGKGIGLRNVRERLQLLYGQKDLLNTIIQGSVFEVELYIPQSR